LASHFNKIQLHHRSCGRKSENKTKTAKRFPNCNCSGVFACKVDWMTFDDVYIDLIVKGEIISICEDIDGF
jgi:hypothetical protein